MAGKNPPRNRASAHEDAWPRQKPPEREEPANWKLVKLHLAQATKAAEVEDKDAEIVANVEYHLQQAIHFLHPPPAQ